MACQTRSGLEIQSGSIEYIYADIRADRVLATQDVELSISPTNAPIDWMPAQWVGAAGKFRSARVLLDGLLPEGNYWVFARITEESETPIIPVGRLRIV